MATSSEKLALAALCLLAAAGSRAGDVIERAHDDWRSGNGAAALRLLQPAAETGDLRAQLLLALIYRDSGAGVHDEAQAFGWYLRAANQGSAEAQFEVGLMYEVGIGVAADPGEANYWYERAVDGGLCPAELDPLERALVGEAALPSTD